MSAALHELLAQLRQLYEDLFAVIDRDPEQEILGVALPVVDGVMSAAREALTAAGTTTGLTARMVDLISPPTVEAGVPIRALDTWIVVGQVLAALGDSPVAHPTSTARAAGRPCSARAACVPNSCDSVIQGERRI